MSKKAQGLIRIFLLLMITFSLQACWDIATTGAQAIYNRQSLQKTVNDQYITMQANKALNVDTKEFKNSHIAVATYNREVLLAGQVPEPWQRIKAEEIVKKIDDIEKVYNLISVQPPSSTLIRMSDSWITSKLKAKLLASNDVDATKIKVVTENGTVFLMGIVQAEEADAAVDIARTTAGVQRVVKIFSYIQIVKKLQA